MTRGKNGAQAQRRADQAAIDTIDRLTERLAEEKRRRLDAEATARRYAAADNTVRILEASNDEALNRALDQVRAWTEIAEQDHKRRLAALHEVKEHMRADLRLQGTTHVEWVEFMCRRYPRLLSALTAGNWTPDGKRPFRDRHSPYSRMEAKLSDTALRRFQAVTGQRHSLQGADDPLDWTLLFEATQAGFTTDETMELLGSDDHS